MSPAIPQRFSRPLRFQSQFLMNEPQRFDEDISREGATVKTGR